MFQIIKILIKYLGAWVNRKITCLSRVRYNELLIGNITEILIEPYVPAY